MKGKMIQSDQSLGGKLVLIAVFMLFFVLVFALGLIPLFSFLRPQSQAIPVRDETGISPVTARRREHKARNSERRLCSQEVALPDTRDNGMIHKNLSEEPEVLTRVANKTSAAPLKSESCLRA